MNDKLVLVWGVYVGDWCSGCGVGRGGALICRGFYILGGYIGLEIFGKGVYFDMKVSVIDEGLLWLQFVGW